MRHQLSEFTKGRIVGLLEANISIRDVAKKIGCSTRTVQKWWNKFRTDGNVDRKKGSGRPSLSSSRQDRNLVLLCKRNRFLPTRKLILGRNFPFSLRTAHRRLLCAGLHARRPLKRTPLTVRHRMNRKDWCKDRIALTADYWHKILWSDESRFSLEFADGRIRVRRMRNERFSECCLMERYRNGRGSLMVWGGLWYNGLTPLIRITGNLNAQRYCEEVLQTIVVPTTQDHDLTFQQDNAPPHSAKVSRDFLEANGIPCLEWPSMSPDLSPIEHIWDIIQRRLESEYDSPAANFDQLFARLSKQWNSLQDEARRLIDSMPQRVCECLLRRGGHTHY